MELIKIDFSKLGPVLDMLPDDEGDDGIERQEGIKVKTRDEVKKPTLYKVFLFNDDYTTMEFVIFILRQCFKKTFEDAQRIMLKIHNEGLGLCGVYTYEIAESKVAQVTSLAKKHGHPLKCTFEEE
jgi:ATP-dependent Clp protease adaptor protein ClpS